MQNLNIYIQEKLLKLQKNKDETKWVNKDPRLNANEEKEDALTYSQICSLSKNREAKSMLGRIVRHHTMVPWSRTDGNNSVLAPCRGEIKSLLMKVSQTHGFCGDGGVNRLLSVL